MTIDQLCDVIRHKLECMSEPDAFETMSSLLAVIEPGEHLSDCAHHNSPAHAPGLCDCKE